MQRQIWETSEGKGGGEKRKKRRLSGKVSPSISVWTQNTQTRERYQIWKGRLTGEQAGREGASVVVQCVNSTSSCPIQSRERERGAQRVTFPGADRLVGVSWDGSFFLYYWALIGHEERHRLPHLRERREREKTFEGDNKIMFVISKTKWFIYIIMNRSIKHQNVWVVAAARVSSCMDLGSIDESPCIEQTEAVLVAVIETGSI